MSCSLAALLVLWVPKYLPLTDLPQHAAQISIWKHLEDPRYGFRDVFQVQYFTPYLVGNAMARLLAEAFSVRVAVKLVLTLAVLGLPLSLWRLLDAARGDRWWALLGFPLAFGYAFLWGFFSYVVALPIGVAQLALALDYREKLGVWRGVGLAALSVVLFGTHLLPFMLCGLSAAALLGLPMTGWKSTLRRLAPLGPSLVLAVVWAFRYRKVEGLAPDVFRYGLARFSELPALWFGNPYDVTALLAGLFAIALFAGSGARLSAHRVRWLPLAIGAAAYLGVPQDYSSVAFLYPRLAIWIVPLSFVATELKERRVRPTIVHGALLCSALAWMGLVFTSFDAFDRDARQFDVVLEKLKPNQRMRSIVFERGGEYIAGGAPFLHFPVWYQVEKGGTTSFSFATSSQSVVVFRPEARRAMPAAIDWLPWQFDAATERDHYDYFVVRASSDWGPKLFAGAHRPPRLLAHEGWWWVYGSDEQQPKSAPLPG